MKPIVLVLLLASVTIAEEVDTINTTIHRAKVALKRTPLGITIAADKLEIDAHNVRAIRFDVKKPAILSPTTVLTLRTGERLYGSVVEGTETNLTFQNRIAGNLKVPIAAIESFLFATTTEGEAVFERHAPQTNPASDILITTSGSHRPGTVLAIVAGAVTVDLDGIGVLKFTQKDALGVYLSALEPTRVETTPHTVFVLLDDGTLLRGEFQTLDAETLTLDHPLKAVVRVPRESLEAIWFAATRAVYLSDLEPVSIEEKAKLISVIFPYQRDRTVLGEKLTLTGRGYRKGLGVHAYSRLTYKLDGNYDSFHAVVGLDDSARTMRTVTGTIRFQVLADGRKLLEDGLLLSTTDQHRTIHLPLRGVQELQLIADFGPSGDALARGLWADAFLVRSQPSSR